MKWTKSEEIYRWEQEERILKIVKKVLFFKHKNEEDVINSYFKLWDFSFKRNLGDIWIGFFFIVEKYP